MNFEKGLFMLMIGYNIFWFVFKLCITTPVPIVDWSWAVGSVTDCSVFAADDWKWLDGNFLKKANGLHLPSCEVCVQPANQLLQKIKFCCCRLVLDSLIQET